MKEFSSIEEADRWAVRANELIAQTERRGGLPGSRNLSAELADHRVCRYAELDALVEMDKMSISEAESRKAEWDAQWLPRSADETDSLGAGCYLAVVLVLVAAAAILYYLATVA